MMASLYTWLKALHVAAAIIFVSGVMGVSVFFAAAVPHRADVAQIVRRWDQRVTTPTMLLVWALGLTLAILGGWFRDGWLVAKLAFVVALSGMHGVQSARLRRMSGGVFDVTPSNLLPMLIIGSVVIIAILVVVKPI